MSQESLQIVHVERFVFHSPLASWRSSHFDTYPKFTLGVGGRTTTMSDSDWCKDLECIRHVLEGYAFIHKALLHFQFGNDEWMISLERDVRLFPKILLCRVKIEHKHYEEHLTITGYCEERETLAKLYEGLLSASFYQPVDAPELPDDPEDWWPYEIPDRMTAYGQLKSPILEAFLTEEDFSISYDRCLERQVQIKKVIILQLKGFPYMEDEHFDYVDIDDLKVLCGDPEIEEKFYSVCPDFGWKEKKPEKETIAAIRDGGEKLAKLIRSCLPKYCDLWIDIPILLDGVIVEERHLVCALA